MHFVFSKTDLYLKVEERIYAKINSRDHYRNTKCNFLLEL